MRNAFLALCVGLIACAPEYPAPEPPDALPQLRVRFESPQALLTPETAQDAVNVLQTANDSLELIALLAVFIDDLMNSFVLESEEASALTAESDEHGALRQPLRVNGDAWARLSYTCGPQGTVNARQFGRAVLRVVLEEPSLEQRYWGDLENCQLSDENGTSTFNASLLVDASAAGELLTSVVGRAFDGEVSLPVDLQFRERADSLSILVPVTGGDLVFTWLPGDGEVQVQDCAGVWLCDFDERRCELGAAMGDCQTSGAFSW